MTDDGLPVVRDPARRAGGTNDPPTLRRDPDDPEPPHNVPSVPNRRGTGVQAPRVHGLRVSWIVWRGPAGVTFEPASTVVVEDGQAVVTAAFTVPGNYVLRATANDNLLATEHDVTDHGPLTPSTNRSHAYPLGSANGLGRALSSKSGDVPIRRVCRRAGRPIRGSREPRVADLPSGFDPANTDYPVEVPVAADDLADFPSLHVGGSQCVFEVPRTATTRKYRAPRGRRVSAEA